MWQFLQENRNVTSLKLGLMIAGPVVLTVCMDAMWISVCSWSRGNLVGQREEIIIKEKKKAGKTETANVDQQFSWAL